MRGRTGACQVFYVNESVLQILFLVFFLFANQSAGEMMEFTNAPWQATVAGAE